MYKLTYVKLLLISSSHTDIQVMGLQFFVLAWGFSMPQRSLYVVKLTDQFNTDIPKTFRLILFAAMIWFYKLSY